MSPTRFIRLKKFIARALHVFGVHEYWYEIVSEEDEDGIPTIFITSGRIQNKLGKATCAICGKVKENTDEK